MGQEAPRDDGPPKTHVVVKRGHRGRYRIATVLDGVRITGDLQIDGVERADKSLDTVALARFAEAASGLAKYVAAARVKP